MDHCPAHPTSHPYCPQCLDLKRTSAAPPVAPIDQPKPITEHVAERVVEQIAESKPEMHEE